MGHEGRFAIEEASALALGQPGLILRDRQSGAEARVVPGYGGDLLGLRLVVRGQPFDLLAPVPTEPHPPRRWFGAPILFPYPNRVRDATYEWEGQKLHLPTAATGHAVHGLVRDRPFTVEARETGEAGARVTLAIRAADHPDLREHYPFDFALRVSYTLSPGGLRTQAEVTNEGGQSMPFGIGFHPFFRFPLVETTRREDCRVLLWGPRVWELDAENLPTGRVLPVPAEQDARGYTPIGETAFDTVYTGLALDDPGAGTWSGRYLDPGASVEVIVVADQAFREAVLFAPLARPLLSIEPYTCATDALNLAAAGVDAGLLTLAPGATWSAGYTITARSVAHTD